MKIINSISLLALLLIVNLNAAAQSTPEVFTEGNGLLSPGDLVFGPDGHLYVSSRQDQVLRFDGVSGEFIDVFAEGNGLAGPTGLTFGPDGHLYVTSFDSNQVLRFNGESGAFIDVFAEGNGLTGPGDLTFDSTGDLYVGSILSSQVLRFNGETGAFIDEFVVGGVDEPAGLAFGPDGHLYVCVWFTKQVTRFDGNTGAFIDGFVKVDDAPVDLAFGPDGNLYVLSRSLSNQEPRTIQLLRFNGETGAFIDVFAEGNELEDARRLAFGPNGDFYIVSRETSRVLVYEGATNVSTLSEDLLPGGYTLHQNYPNPFNQQTVIAFDLAVTGPAHISVYNTYGQRVLADRVFPSGRNELIWKPGDLSSGVYYYRFESDQFSATQQLVYVR